MTEEPPDGAARSDASAVPPGAPEEAFALVLLGLSGMTPARLARVLHGRSPSAAWAEVLAGVVDIGRLPRARKGESSPAALARRWAQEAERLRPDAVLRGVERVGIQVLLQGDPRFPVRLAADPGAPPVLLALGNPPAASVRPAVALVGTRSATPAGLDVATELGRTLAAAGVVVVSGLAAGIDGAAHRGALEASGPGPVAVVAGGPDVVYPAAHRRLWEEVAGAGVILSEVAPGTRPEQWRFAWRNRLIAALADVVVVVESHAAGGSFLTAEAAARRGIPVMAVPGSVRSSASAGTNALLADGCAPARDAADVLAALALTDPAWQRRGGAGPHGEVVQTGEGVGPAGQSRLAPADPVEREVLARLTPVPTTLAALAERSDRDLGELASALGRLVAAGHVRAGAGWWALA